MPLFGSKSTLSLRFRVIVSIILLMVVVVGTFGYITVRSIHLLVEKLMWESYSSYARSFAAFSAKSFAERDVEELQRHLNVAFSQPDVLFAVATDKEGKIVARAGNLDDFLPFRVHREVSRDNTIRVQEIGEEPEGLFHSSGHTFLITSEVVYGNQDIGVVQLAVNSAATNQRLAHISLWGFRMVMVVLVLGMGVLFVVDRKLKKNILRLIQITRSMAAGDLSQRVEIRTGDELENLGGSFNLMAEAIKQREEEILTTRKKYENLFQESVIPTFVLGERGRILDANKAGETLVGYHRGELIGVTLERLSKKPERIRAVLDELTQEGRNIKNFEHEIVNRSGGTIVVEMNAGPIFDEHNRLVSVIATLKDITQQKQLERQVQKYTQQLEHLVEVRTQELREEKSKLQLILDNVPSAFIMLDQNLRVQSVSAQFEAVLGRGSEEVLGKPCEVCPVLCDAEGNCPSRRAMQTGEIQWAVDRLPTPSGDTKYIEHVAIPIRRNQDIEAILEIVTDVTDRKRFEDQLIRTEKLSATGEMAAVIAHEMRNSLTSVKLILQCLTDSVDDNDLDGQSLDVAIEAVNRMESTVNQLLEFAKPSEVQFEAADLNDLVEQSFEFCKYQFQKKQVSVKKLLSPELPPLELDPERMREVLINLFLNAVDAVDPGGSISVETRVMTLDRPLTDSFDHKSIVLKKGSSVIRVSVRDNGRGIPPDGLRRIFDPFYTTKTKGTGLGLTMAKRAIGEHSGILFAESQVGHGSTFTIVLPVKSAASPAVRKVPSAQQKM